MASIAYHRPASIDEALELGRWPGGARFLAGGTDLLVKLRQGLERPRALVSLRNITELQGIEVSDAGADIGAAVTIAEILEHDELGRRYPLLQQAAGRLGSPQIRQTATLGGNLGNCSPCADTAPALLVYGARLQLQGPAGRREVDIAEFLRGPGQSCLAPGELLCRVRVAPAPAGARTVYFKKGRVRVDLALASLAALLVLDDGKLAEVRLAAGSVAPTCLRLERAEALLRGQRPDREIIDRAARAAAEDISPIDDVRASAAYRRRLVEVFVRRAVEGLCREAGE